MALKGYSRQMAQYFCEDEATFDLRACFSHLHEFCDVIKKCRRVCNLLVILVYVLKIPTLTPYEEVRRPQKVHQFGHNTLMN